MRPIILSSSRKDDRLQLKFVKNQGFVNLIIKIIGKFHIHWKIFQDENEKTGKITIEKIKDIEDEIFHFEDEHIKIDIFVGYRKVIFIMVSSKKLQQQFLDEISAISKWKP